MAVAILTLVIAAANPIPTSACGWWGDGEDEDEDAIEIGADGRPIQTPDITQKKTQRPAMQTGLGPIGIPGLAVPAPRSGYGIVVTVEGEAVPYLDAIKSWPMYSIQHLRRAGFLGVIDLGAHPPASALHRQETEAIGMKYFGILIAGRKPTGNEVSQFAGILSATDNFPLLVFSRSARLLGEVWVSYRLSKGISPAQALREGQRIGLTAKAATDIKASIKAQN